MSNLVENLIIRFPNPECKIIEYDTKKISLEKFTEYYTNQPSLDNSNFKELDIYNIKQYDILLPNIDANINWKDTIKNNLLAIINSENKSEFYKDYLVINFSLKNENFFYLKKNKNILLLKEKHPLLFFVAKNVEYYESSNEFKVFSLDWDFCLIQDILTKETKLICKKNFVSSLIIEKEGEDIYEIFMKKMENKYSIRFNTDYNNIKKYITKIQLKDVEIINNMENADLPEKEEILVHFIKSSGEKRFPDDIHFVYGHEEQYFHLDSLKYFINFIVDKFYKGHGAKTVNLTQNKENVIYKIKK